MKILQNNTRLIYNKFTNLIVVSILITLTFSPIASSTQNLDSQSPEPLSGTKELDLLRAEHYLYFTATENVSEFNIRYAFPPDYSYQVPIMMELLNDSNADVINYRIQDDKNEPNLIVNFTIGEMEKNETKYIHFNYYVLVNNFDYSDYPKKVKFPKNSELPDETKIWLTPTDVVQSKSLIIKLKAREIRGINNNLVRFADRVAKFTRLHRYFLFLFQLYTGTLGPQDAITTLFRNGECPGRSHLGAALFRSQGVPARIILANPSNKLWYQVHCMNEYYLPNYGWILTEVHKGIVPYEAKNQVILRICYPEDEQNTHTDYFFKKMTGVEYWFWIDNDNVIPYYVDLVEGSKTNMFKESEQMTDSFTADYSFFITKQVFYYYKMFLGESLTGDNQAHFENAVNIQFEAMVKLKQQNPEEYAFLMDMALDEYKEIEL